MPANELGVTHSAFRFSGLTLRFVFAVRVRFPILITTNKGIKGRSYRLRDREQAINLWQ